MQQLPVHKKDNKQIGNNYPCSRERQQTDKQHLSHSQERQQTGKQPLPVHKKGNRQISNNYPCPRERQLTDMPE